MFRKSVSIILALNLLLVGALPYIAADELQSVLNELEDTREILADLGGKINWALETQDELVVDIRNIDIEIYVASQELSRIGGNLLRLGEDISVTGDRLTDTEENIAAIDSLVRERLRVLYKNSNLSYLEVLFSATSYSDFLQRFELVRRVIASDVSLLSSLNEMRLELDILKRQLENDYAEQQRLEQWEIFQIDNLEELHAEKSWIMDGVQSQLASWLAAEKEMEAKSAELEELARRLTEANRNRIIGSGIYAWPLDGYYSVSSEFGWRADPFGGSYSNNHTGLDIAAPYGAEILAVDTGIVIFAEYGYNGGYGNMIMIDHGQGVATLYGHCSSIAVSEEQLVSKGDVIGYIGNSGWSTGPHLHVEFRIDGICEDPAMFLY